MSGYTDFFQRNIGFISQEEQEILKGSAVALFGVGGLGGVIAELLARSGIGSLTLVEPDVIEVSNLNRHVFAFQNTLNKSKTETAEQFLKQINPELTIHTYKREQYSNLDAIFAGVQCAVLAADKIRGCLLVSRKAYELDIPLVEGWAIPFANVRTFTRDTPTLEEVYKLPTKGKKVEELTGEQIEELNLQMIQSLKKIEGVEEFYSDEAKKRVEQGMNPSFAPFVWFTAVLMTIETIKVLLKWDNLALAPNWFLYNPFTNTIPGQEVTE